MRTLIIDDEPNVRQVLRNILELYTPQAEVIGEADSVKTGKQMIKELQPELVFLDIQMPDGTGFDLLSALESINFSFVVVTAFEQYAIKAIKFSAIDYLLKPVNTHEVIRSVEKAALSHPDEQHNRIKLDNFLNRNKSEPRVVLKTQDSIYSVKVNELIRCESDKNYSTVFLENGKSLILSRTLKDMESLLSEEGFFRVHQSHLINLRKVEYFEKSSAMIFLSDGSKVPVSSRRKDYFIRLMEKL